MDPAISLFIVGFQFAVAALLLRSKARRRELALLALLFALNGAAAALGFVADAPSGDDGVFNPAWSIASIAVDTATGPVLLAFLAERLGGRRYRALSWGFLGAGAIHGVLVLAGGLWSPELWTWLMDRDIHLRASPLFAGWILTVAVLARGDRLDRFIAVAWGIRAAAWGVHGPQRIIVRAQLGLAPDLETVWLTGLLVAAAVASFYLWRNKDAAGEGGQLVLGIGLLIGLGSVAANLLGPYGNADQLLLFFARGILILAGLDTRLIQRALTLTIPASAAGFVLFQGLRLRWTPPDAADIPRTMAAYATWAWAALVMTLVRLEHRSRARDSVETDGPTAPPGYTLERPLRQTATATTFVGRHKPTGDRVVLKFLPWGSGLGQREARAMEAVRHANLVALRATHNVNGRMVLVTDFVAGQNLRERLAIGPLLSSEQKKLAVGLLDALEALHLSDVVHGDVKPSNIMLTTDGEIRLIDLGAARTPADDSTITLAAAGAPLGTPHFMPPEVAQGARPTQAADVWAAAATLWEVMTDSAYLAQDVTDDAGTLLRRAAAHTDYKPVPDVSPAWNKWFHSALAVDPAKRFSDATAAKKNLPVK